MNSFISKKNIAIILFVAVLIGVLIYFVFDTEIILFITIIILALIYSVVFSRSAIVKRKLSKIEMKKISDCQTGDYVKVEGKVNYLGTPIIAPFSGRPCVYYYVLVEVHVEHVDSFTEKGVDLGSSEIAHWKKIIEEEQGNDFVIRDVNSYALIETENIKSTLKEDKIYHTRDIDNPLEQLNKYLEKHVKDSPKISNTNESIRYKEGVIVEGETITVAGKMAWKKKSELKVEIPVERILVVSPNNKVPVYLSNGPDAPKSN